MAADDWLEQAVTLLSSWVFQAVALSSLGTHLVLVFFSGIRRRQAYGGRRLLLWLAYQVNNWAATYVLGNLYLDTAPREKQLYAFWVPFLLLHLARPDNMSAYSMEDNALSGRVMLFVPLQSLGAILILYRYIHIDASSGTLRSASWIMLILAVFKYAESAVALRRGDLGSIRRSFKPATSGETSGHWGVDDGKLVEDDEGLLLVAHDLFDICKGAFTDHSVGMDIRKRATDSGWRNMCRVVEMELSLMYDMMYTKAAMVHTWGGYGIRVVSPFLTAAALSLFWFRYRDPAVLHSRDLVISYVLLGTTLVLDVAWLLRAIASTWTYAFFKSTRWHRVKHAVICRGRWKRLRRRLGVSLTLLDPSRLSVPSSSSAAKEPSSSNNYRVWSGIIGQHNLLRDFHHSKRLRSRLAESVGLEESWNEHCYSGPGSRALDFSRDVSVRDDLFERIWSMILLPAYQKKEEEKMPQEPREKADPQLGHRRRRKLDRDLGFDPEFEEVVLIWHIATDVFLWCAPEHEHEHEHDAGGAWPRIERAIKAVSDYMLFLIAVRPGMLPGLKLRSMYERTRSALNTLWDGDDDDDGRASRAATGGVEKKLVRILRRKVDDDTLHQSSLILSDATRCAMMMLRRLNTTTTTTTSTGPWLRMPALHVLQKLQGLCPELFETQELDMPTMLDLIFDVWVRLLIYASIRCSRDSHAKQLGRGGELTTIIWILTQHACMFPERRQ